MSKNNRKSTKFRFAGDEDIALNDTYTTQTGMVLKLEPVAPTLLQMVEQSIPVPERPAYDAETAFGEIQHYYHDETTLETEEEKHKWKSYINARHNRNAELTSKANRILLSKGVVISEEIAKRFPEWEEEHTWLGIPVPTEERDRRYHFLMTEIIKSPNDIIGILENIMQLMGMDQETLRAAENSFRSTMAT